jgi:hypothetical protein
MERISTMEQLTRFAGMTDWSEAFLRELHYISPHRFERTPDGVLEGPRPRTAVLRALIVLPAIENPLAGVELICVGAYSFRAEPGEELVFGGSIDHHGVYLIMSEDRQCFINTAELYWRLVDESVWGPVCRYATEYPFDEDGDIVDRTRL